MAETERVGGLVIPIEYEYDEAGIKKAISDAKSIEKETKSCISQTKKNISTLNGASEQMAKVVNKNNKVIASALDAVAKKYDKVNAALLRYANAQKTKSTALSNQKLYKSKLAEKGSTIKRGKVYDAEGNIDETATNKLLSLSNTLAMARNSQKAALNSLTTATMEYKQAIVNVGNTAISERQKEEDAIKRVREELEKQKEATKALVRQKISDSIDKVNAKLKTLRQRLKQIDIMKLVAKIYVLKRAWNMMTDFVDQASSLIENVNLLESVFGDASDEAKEFVNAVADNFGLNPNTLSQIAATFKQMANAMGQSAETGTEMSEALTYLALDLSSLRNMDVEDVAANLVSGISGQSRAVVKYGSNITQDAINEWLKANDLYTSSLSQQDKQMVRTILLIQQQKDSWGDMAKTINTFANQQRVLNDQWEVLKQNLGSILIGTFDLTDTFDQAKEKAGLMTKAIWYLNGALIAVNEVLNAIVPKTEDLNGATSAMSEDVSDSLDEVEESAKGALASFDKFNTLGSGGSSVSDLLISAEIQKKLAEQAAKYTDAVKKKTEQVNMFAKDIAKTLLQKFFPNFEEWLKSNPEGTFAEWAKASGELGDKFSTLKDDLWSIVQLVLTLKNPLLGILSAWAKSALNNPDDSLNGIVKGATSLYESIVKLSQQLGPFLEKLVPIVQKVIEIVGKVMEWAAQNDNLETTIWLLVAAFGAWKIVTITSNVVKAVKEYKALNAVLKQTAAVQKEVAATQFSVKGTMTGFLKAGVAVLALVGAAVGSFMLLDKVIGEISKPLQVAASAFGVLAGVIAAVAIAKQGLEAGWAAIAFGAALGVAIGSAVSLVKSSVEVSKHADGGFQSGGLFYAGEKGPEWVGKQGNTSTILNDSQMSDIMRDSVAQGVTVALAKSGGMASNNSSGVGNVYLDGNKVGTFVAGNSGFRKEANRRMTGLNWR